MLPIDIDARQTGKCKPPYTSIDTSPKLHQCVLLTAPTPALMLPISIETGQHSPLTKPLPAGERLFALRQGERISNPLHLLFQIRWLAFLPRNAVPLIRLSVFTIRWLTANNPRF